MNTEIGPFYWRRKQSLGRYPRGGDAWAAIEEDPEITRPVGRRRQRKQWHREGPRCLSQHGTCGKISLRRMTLVAMRRRPWWEGGRRVSVIHVEA